jgi:glycosyltransferase involved in cell wall biosynthesis
MKQFENLSFSKLFNKKLLLNYFEKTFLFKQYNKNKGNHFIAISNDTLNFAKTTCYDYPVSLLPNAIDISAYKRGKVIPNDIIRIINIGSFVAKKNQLFFIEIAKILKSKQKSFEIVLLGDGIMFEKVKNSVIENHLSEYIIMPGAVSNVNEYLNNANMYVHTATIEPFGLVLVEAMAAELPIITLNGKGNKDLIIEGENGYMIDEANASIFVDRVIQLWQDMELYQKISSSAKQFAMNYDIKIYVSKLIELYNR